MVAGCQRLSGPVSVVHGVLDPFGPGRCPGKHCRGPRGCRRGLACLCRCFLGSASRSGKPCLKPMSASWRSFARCCPCGTGLGCWCHIAPPCQGDIVVWKISEECISAPAFSDPSGSRGIARSVRSNPDIAPDARKRDRSFSHYEYNAPVNFSARLLLGPVPAESLLQGRKVRCRLFLFLDALPSRRFFAPGSS